MQRGAEVAPQSMRYNVAHVDVDANVGVPTK